MALKWCVICPLCSSKMNVDPHPYVWQHTRHCVREAGAESNDYRLQGSGIQRNLFWADCSKCDFYVDAEAGLLIVVVFS